MREPNRVERPVVKRRPGRLRAVGAAVTLAAGALVGGLTPASATDTAPLVSAISPYDAVDPFIGTELDPAQNKGNSAYGNTWPGATTPFGMVQSSPTTYRSSDGDQKGGYEYSADK
ncbi:glycoside hydrolase family 92 protein, partial [Streptomyces rubiginosohelvolus]